MALLHFENLFAHRPDQALRNAARGLDDFEWFLVRARARLRDRQPTATWIPYGTLYRIRAAKGGSARSTEIVTLLSAADLKVYARSSRGRAATPVGVREAYPDEQVLLLDEVLPAGVQVDLVADDIDATCIADCEEDRRAWSHLRSAWVEIEATQSTEDADIKMRAFFEHDAQVREFPSEPGAGSQARGSESGDRIKVLDGSEAGQSLLRLERFPRLRILQASVSTSVIDRQLAAVRDLQNKPMAHQLPLLKLLEGIDHVRWPRFTPAVVSEWFELTDPHRAGAKQQQDFVQHALATPDFMLLEGPPGSGKTTAILELVLQLAKEGKTVLLAASTHVAVDNVIERLKKKGSRHRDRVVVVRVGDETRVSEAVKPYCLEHIVKTERIELRNQLDSIKTPSPSQREMAAALRGEGGDDLIRSLWLNSAQLVCGTTIGLLRHVLGRETATGDPYFDVLIVDEASKVPFSEFLVPARLAKRWIIVGDRCQLSPFIEEDAIAASVEAAIHPKGPVPRPVVEQVCLDVTRPLMRHGPALVFASADSHLRDLYAAQARERLLSDPESVVVLDDTGPLNPFLLGAARVIVGAPRAVLGVADALPIDSEVIGANGPAVAAVHRRARASRPSTARRDDRPKSWQTEIAWRLIRDYENRLLPEIPDEDAGAADTQGSLGRSGASAPGKTPERSLADEVRDLMPGGALVDYPERVADSVDVVRRVALPSILESLQCGFGQGRRLKTTTLTRGFTGGDLTNRLARLTFQHRMHPEIAAFSRKWIYREKALESPPGMAAEREWSYRTDRRRFHVVDVVDGSESDGSTKSNAREADEMMAELRAFTEWARLNPKGDEPWSVAVLAFYRGQETLLRERLRKLCGQQVRRNFSLRDDSGRVFVAIDLCIVDRFQGQEADVVLLSFVRTRSEGFLGSPNRLNVALTRARYQLLIYGKVRFLRGRRSRLLRRLFQDRPSSLTFDGGVES